MKLLRFTREHPVLSILLALVGILVLNVLVNGPDGASRPNADAQKWHPSDAVKRWGLVSPK